MKNRHPLININIQRQSIQPTSEVSQASNTETSEATPAPGPSSSSSCAFSNENGRATTANTMPISNFLRKPPSARKQDQIDRQLVKMIVKGHHALRIVEEPDFKILVDMMSYCPGYRTNYQRERHYQKPLFPKSTRSSSSKYKKGSRRLRLYALEQTDGQPRQVIAI